MKVKILTSDVIGLDAFCKAPADILTSASDEGVAVFDNNAPLFYAVTPERLAHLLTLASAAQEKPNDVSLESHFYQTAPCWPPEALPVPAGKFIIYDGWQPDADFQRQAAIWGITLTAPPEMAELAAFTSYWRAEGRAFHHIQWQQKLARHLQQARATSGRNAGNRNTLPEPDKSIPDGFRG